MILNKLLNCLYIWLNSFSCRTGIIILTYLTVGGQGMVRPWGSNGLWQYVKAKVDMNYFSKMHRHSSLSRKTGSAHLIFQGIMLELLDESPPFEKVPYWGDISLCMSVQFFPLTLAFPSLMICLKTNSLLQYKSQFTVIYSRLPGHFQLSEEGSLWNPFFTSLLRLQIPHQVFHEKKTWHSECKQLGAS